MPKKAQAALREGFKGPPCEHCGWGPSTERSYRILDNMEFAFGQICIDCLLCFERAVKALTNLHGGDALSYLLDWMRMEGYHIMFIEAD